MSAADLQIHTVVSRPFQENTYIVWHAGRSDCLVFDPGLEPELILDFLKEHHLKPAAIVLTHGHGDHIGGNAALKAAYPDAPLVIGEKDRIMLTDPVANMSAFFGFRVTSPDADRVVREGDRLEWAGVALEVLEIPGHSPGHVAYVHRGEPNLVFGGDVLFQGSVGRTDLPEGSSDQLFTGIRDKLFTLPDDTLVLPGHGPTTTVAREKATNPFVGET